MPHFRSRYLGLLAATALVFFGAEAALPPPALAQATDAAAAAAPQEETVLTAEDLEILVARIALYPDDLVALVISASLYPVQIVQAARFLEEVAKDPGKKPNDKWDGSVISLLNYPEVVKMMNDDLDWTEQLGEVALAQQKDLLVAIQQLRDKAVADGILKSDQQVTVSNDNGNVVVQSADPQVIAVPSYPPQMLYDPTYVVPATPIVYSQPYPSYFYPTAPYWAGFITGAAFAAVVDWNDWGTWGGDVNFDIDIDHDRIDFDFDKIDIDKIDVDKFKDLDFRNIDRSKIDLKNADIDRNKLKRNLESNDRNRVASKVKDRPGVTDKTRPAGKDVRASVQDGLKNKPATRPKPAVGAKPGVGAGGARPQPPMAGGADRPRPTPAAAKKSPPKAKPAARVDHRPSKPSVMGNPGQGKATKVNANRGKASRGGGGGGFKGGGGGGFKGGGGGGGRRR